MVQPAPGEHPGDKDDVPASAQPPVTATDGVAGQGTLNGAALDSGALNHAASYPAGDAPESARPPILNGVPNRAGGPLLPPEWPRPLDPSPFAIEDEADTAEGGPGADVWYVDPVDDPANWGPPLPPPEPPRRSVVEILWPWGVRGIVETVEVLALALLMFLFVRSIGQNFIVDGGSMEPTFHNGEMLIVNKLVYRSFDLSWVPGIDGTGEWRPFGQPEPGDVVVFRFPQDPRRDFIKRVIAVPGQTVEVRGGTVFVDGQPRSEPYLDRPPAYEYGPVTVPEGQYFVLGDNRNNSFDSHSWGMLGESFMIGRAEVRYWPLDRAGRIDNNPVAAAKPQAGVLRFP